jgi:hypothetical protein
MEFVCSSLGRTVASMTRWFFKFLWWHGIDGAVLKVLENLIAFVDEVK